MGYILILFLSADRKFRLEKEYVHEKELKVGTYEWEGKMLDPFEPCFIYNDNIDDYDE